MCIPPLFLEPVCVSGGNDSVISQEDIDSHNKESGMWGVIQGKVYDLHSFSALVPDSADRLLASVFKDASRDFDSTGHSDFVLELLEQCLVGTFREAEVREKPLYLYW